MRTNSSMQEKMFSLQNVDMISSILALSDLL